MRQLLCLDGFALVTLFEGFVQFHDVSMSVGLTDNREVLAHAFESVGYGGQPINIIRILALRCSTTGQYYRMQDGLEEIFLQTPSALEDAAAQLKLTCRRGGTLNEQHARAVATPHKYVDVGGSYSVHFGKGHK